MSALATEILSEERKKQDEVIRETIMAKLIETGEKERMKEYLRERLSAMGWQNSLKEYAKEVIRKKGSERISVEELVVEMIPHGRGEFSTLSFVASAESCSYRTC